MKAQEIRNIRDEQDIKEGVFYLNEIAAQFADLNERLDGFMSSMAVLAKNIAELNLELRKSNEKRHRWRSEGYR